MVVKTCTRAQLTEGKQCTDADHHQNPNEMFCLQPGDHWDLII